MAEEVAPAGRPLVIEADHQPYLVAQQGRLYDLRDDLPAWTAAYQRGLRETLESMRPALPASCRAIMDVGSGLGGIDILLSRHYGGKPFISLVDGANDPPEVKRHAETFNNMAVALDFQSRNGVENVGFCTPSALFTPRPMDLIISLASWCFHYPPETYLPWVLQCCHAETVLILDVRRSYVWWNKTLDTALERVAELAVTPKFIRRAYRVR